MLETFIQISPSQIGMLLECPRCLWLHFREKVKRPSGPFPSLPGGMDFLLKDYFDGFRAKNTLPPELHGKIKEKLFTDRIKLDIWRNNRRGIRVEFPKLNILLKGSIDDLLINNRGEFIPLDFKTRGFALKEETAAHYAVQLNLYALLFKYNNYKVANYGYLLFFWPKKYKNKTATFNTELIKMKLNEKDGLNILKKASRIIKGPKPKSHSDCQFCLYRNNTL